jgi:alkanesulfonate monooxygenase SsuD/methylene tetrahydromethanopterin reductase-like flavin-dependent oxidoreductase (luciferase family)
MATRITDDMLEQFAVIGTHDEIVKKIKEKCAGVIDRVNFTLPTRTPEDEERLKDMIKQLKAA